MQVRPNYIPAELAMGDDERTYPGYYNPKYLWNGFAVPAFDRATIDIIMTAQHASDPRDTHEWQGDVFIRRFTDATDPEWDVEEVNEPFAIVVDNQTKIVYDCGESWTWQWIPTAADEIVVINTEPEIQSPNQYLTAEENELLLHDALADIAYEAGRLGYYSGNSRADVSQFIFWAKQFEKMHIETNWANVDYMEMMEDYVRDTIIADMVQKALYYFNALALYQKSVITAQFENEVPEEDKSKSYSFGLWYYKTYIREQPSISDTPKKALLITVSGGIIESIVSNFKGGVSVDVADYDNPSIASWEIEHMTEEEYSKAYDQTEAQIVAEAQKQEEGKV